MCAWSALFFQKLMTLETPWLLYYYYNYYYYEINWLRLGGLVVSIPLGLPWVFNGLLIDTYLVLQLVWVLWWQIFGLVFCTFGFHCVSVTAGKWQQLRVLVVGIAVPCLLLIFVWGGRIGGQRKKTFLPASSSEKETLYLYSTWLGWLVFPLLLLLPLLLHTYTTVFWDWECCIARTRDCRDFYAKKKKREREIWADWYIRERDTKNVLRLRGFKSYEIEMVLGGKWSRL